MEFHHVSVLLNECIENLNIKPDGVYVDCTMGGAGHSKEIVKRLSDKGLFIGFDQDKNAIATAKERWQRSLEYQGRHCQSMRPENPFPILSGVKRSRMRLECHWMNW